MFVKAMIAAVSVANLTNAFVSRQYMDETPAVATPTPGAIQSFINVENLSTFVKDMTALAPYYALQGKTIDLGMDIEVAGIEFRLNSVTIDAVTIGEGSVSFIDDSNTLRTRIANANFTLSLDAEATSKIPLPLDITQVVLKNASIQLDLGTKSDDEVTW